MKSIALIIWLLSTHGQDQIVERSHYDDMAACEAKAQAVAEHYAQQGGKTRYLCHPVIEEVGEVDDNGNPIEVR